MATDDRDPRPPEPPQKRRGTFARQLALALELPFIPISAIVIGGGAGFLLDERLRTSPLFTLLLGALGFAAGIYELLRRLSKEEKRDAGG